MKLKELTNGSFFTCSKLNNGEICQLLTRCNDVLITFPHSGASTFYGWIIPSESMSEYDVEDLTFIKQTFERMTTKSSHA